MSDCTSVANTDFLGPPDEGGGAWLRPCGVIWGPVGRALWFLLHRACLANFVIHRGPRLAAGSALPRWLLWFGAWWPAPKTSVGGDGRGLCAWHVVRTHTHPKSEEPYIDKLVGAVTATFKENAWFAGTWEKRRLTARWSGSWQGSGLTGFARVLDSTKFQLRDASPVTAVGIGCCLRTWAWAGASVPLSRPAQLFCLPAQCMLVRLRGCIEEHEV